LKTGETISKLADGDFKTIAKTLSLVENEGEGAKEILANLPFKKNVPIIGITGPPGAGKSSVVNACIGQLVENNKRVAVLAVDPSSPFNFGSLLGDRVRMEAHFNNDKVFIRSVASRGHLGGLSTRIYEMADILANANFDYIFIETVGVGQSEVEIAGVADITVVVLVPEAGDEIQAMKSGIMEIADVFVVNKSDREGAGKFASTLQALVHTQDRKVEVISTVAIKNEGIRELLNAIEMEHQNNQINEKKVFLLAQRAWSLIAGDLMKKYPYSLILKELEVESQQTNFNIYRYVQTKLS
jgi:LAO/AO transport system kinase